MQIDLFQTGPLNQHIRDFKRRYSHVSLWTDWFLEVMRSARFRRTSFATSVARPRRQATALAGDALPVWKVRLQWIYSASLVDACQRAAAVCTRRLEFSFVSSNSMRFSFFKIEIPRHDEIDHRICRRLELWPRDRNTELLRELLEL